MCSLGYVYWWRYWLEPNMSTVYGTTAFLETAQSKLVALMDALVTDMASIDPKIAHVYQRHATADLRLNAVSVELAGESTSTPLAPTASFAMLPFSFRVHTAYDGGEADAVKIMRLLNSIANKLLENIDLGDNYLISTSENENVAIAGLQEFEDSMTIGGEINIKVQVPVDYT